MKLFGYELTLTKTKTKTKVNRIIAKHLNRTIYKLRGEK